MKGVSRSAATESPFIAPDPHPDEQGEENPRHRAVTMLNGERSKHGRKPDRGSDRKVDAAGDDDKRSADGRDADNSRLRQNRINVARGEETRRELAQDDADQEKHDRDRARRVAEKPADEGAHGQSFFARGAPSFPIDVRRLSIFQLYGGPHWFNQGKRQSECARG